MSASLALQAKFVKQVLFCAKASVTNRLEGLHGGLPLSLLICADVDVQSSL